VTAPLFLPATPLRDDAANVVLRPWGRRPDAEALVAAWNDPDVARWTRVPAERSVIAAQRWIDGEGRRRADGVAIDLGVADATDPDRVLGEVGLAVLDSDRGWAEAGWWLTPTARGRGLATTALSLVTAWALNDLPVALVFARTQLANPASAAVAERAGFTFAGHADDGSRVWRSP